MVSRLDRSRISPERPIMHFTPDQRQAWLETTAGSPLNRWLDSQVRGPDGGLDLECLHEVAMRFGIDRRAQYAHLNPGQQRMNIGNLLRRAVPQSLYLGSESLGEAAVAAAPATAGFVLPPDNERPELITGASVRQLLEIHGQISDELIARGVTRTSNNPGGDFAELLFSLAFGRDLAGNSASGFDAKDADGLRYQ